MFPLCPETQQPLRSARCLLPLHLRMSDAQPLERWGGWQHMKEEGLETTYSTVMLLQLESVFFGPIP